MDLRVVERAVAAAGQEPVQVRDPGGVGVLGTLERSGDLEQFIAYRGGAIVQQRVASRRALGLPGAVGGPSQPAHQHAALACRGPNAPALQDARELLTVAGVLAWTGRSTRSWCLFRVVILGLCCVVIRCWWRDLIGTVSAGPVERRRSFVIQVVGWQFCLVSTVPHA